MFGGNHSPPPPPPYEPPAIVHISCTMFFYHVRDMYHARAVYLLPRADCKTHDTTTTCVYVCTFVCIYVCTCICIIKAIVP